MVTIEKIPIGSLPEFIRISYENDKDLLETYHTFNGTLDYCVGSEMREIRKAHLEYSFECYKVLHVKRPVGYFVKADNFLYSFAIKRIYRKKNILIEWWQLVKESFNKEFVVMLYDKNVRVIDFLLKQGMKIISQDDLTKMVILK